MPHINVKHFPSLMDGQRDHLSFLFVEAVREVIHCPQGAISFAFELVVPEIWMKEVYQIEVLKRKEIAYIFPDYNATKETV